MAHGWLMDYSKKFSKMYRKASQWVYNHYTAAHEETGQHAATLDQDLKEFLQHYLETYKESHNIVIFLAGDHGMRYGEFLDGIEGIQEHRLPVFFMITQKRLLDAIGANSETLEHNSLRLTTKPDLRETIHWLAKW
jgi:hypothetical protein